MRTRRARGRPRPVLASWRSSERRLRSRSRWAVMRSSSASIQTIVCSRWWRSRSACSGLSQMMNRASPAPSRRTSLTQVVTDVLGAALAGWRGLDQVAARAHAHSGDVVAAGPVKIGKVVRRGDPAVHDGDDARASSSAWRFGLDQHGLVVGVAGPASHPRRDALSGHHQPGSRSGVGHHGVLGLAVLAERVFALFLFVVRGRKR